MLGEAAEEAIWSLDTAAAVGLLRRAVALVLADDSLRRPLEIELGYALKNEGNVAESIDVLTAVEDWARAPVIVEPSSARASSSPGRG